MESKLKSQKGTKEIGPWDGLLVTDQNMVTMGICDPAPQCEPVDAVRDEFLGLWSRRVPT